ncbi:MAG: hypothetical protein Q7S53_03975 [bacterium]|nr:hypothetical protein [bacterium]
MTQTKTPREYVENFVKVSLGICAKDMGFHVHTEREVEEIMDTLDAHPFLKLFGDREIVFREYPDSSRYAKRFANDILAVRLGRGDEKTIVILEASALLGRWSKELVSQLKNSVRAKENA